MKRLVTRSWRFWVVIAVYVVAMLGLAIAVFDRHLSLVSVAGQWFTVTLLWFVWAVAFCAPLWVSVYMNLRNKGAV